MQSCLNTTMPCRTESCFFSSQFFQYSNSSAVLSLVLETSPGGKINSIVYPVHKNYESSGLKIPRGEAEGVDFVCLRTDVSCVSIVEVGWRGHCCSRYSSHAQTILCQGMLSSAQYPCFCSRIVNTLCVHLAYPQITCNIIHRATFMLIVSA